MQNNQIEIERNVKAHNKIAKKYRQLHGEIYNEIEQSRLFNEISYAKNLLTNTQQNSSEKLKALDYGCGDGNMTKQLLDLDFDVTSADIYTGFLDLVKNNFPQTNTLLLNGMDLKEIKSESFDFICTYSVLHHIPDYLMAIQEFVRVLKPGGIIFLDHENSPDFWTKNIEIKKFYQDATNFRYKVKKFFHLPNYYHKLIQVFLDKKHSAEGDIHVFPDNHLDWDKILEIINTQNFSKIEIFDYLLYKKGYYENIYKTNEQKLNDTRLLIATKKAKQI